MEEGVGLMLNRYNSFGALIYPRKCNVEVLLQDSGDEGFLLRAWNLLYDAESRRTRRPHYSEKEEETRKATIHFHRGNVVCSSCII